MKMILSLAVAAAISLPSLATGQGKPANPRDLSGVWMNDNTLDETMKREGRTRMTDAERVERPRNAERPLTPEYEKVFQDFQAERAKLEDGAEPCAWPGMPGIMTYPYPFEIIHSTGRINFLFEAESQVRRVFMDRKEHLPFDELDPSYNGDSIGRWEGDVLVIETIGFNTLATVRGLPHSEEMKIVERIRWVDADTIEDEITITDPKAFTRPVVNKVVYSKRPDWRIKEYSCNENNRDAPDAKGERSGA